MARTIRSKPGTSLSARGNRRLLPLGNRTPRGCGSATARQLSAHPLLGIAARSKPFRRRASGKPRQRQGRHRKCGAPARARLFKPSLHVLEGRETSLLPVSRLGIRYTIDSGLITVQIGAFVGCPTTPESGTGFSAPSGQTEDRGV